MRGRYIVLTVLAITCGTGAAGWRAASYISSRIKAAPHLASMVQPNAEEKAKVAELALGVSEAAERFARQELALERKRREAAEQALDKAVNRTARVATVLAAQGNMTKSLHGNSADAELTKPELVAILAAQGTTKKGMESKLDDLDTILDLLDEMVAQQVAARRRLRAELDNSKVQLLQQSATTRTRKTRGARRIASRSTPRHQPIWWQNVLHGQ
jgi:hypothetical protein